VRPRDCRPALRELASNVADQREHGTTGEVPIERFRRAEARALRPIAGVPPFAMAYELVRKVQADCVIGVDGNAYSVPWRLIGESVRVVIAGDQLRISHAGREVAVHLNLQTHHDLKMARRNLKPEEVERIKALRAA
jgi:hypothetical protein